MIIRTKSASVLAVLVLFFSLFSSAPSYAAALAVTFPSSSHGFVEGAWSSVATSTGTTPAVTGDATGASIRLTITASNSADRLRLADVTSISAASGLTLTDFDTTGAGLAEIAIEGAVADVSASIATLEYNPGTGGSSTISVSVLDGVGSIFGGHYYEAVASGTVWKDAGGYTASNPRTAAALLTNGTCTGYLATITSAQENAIAQALVPAGQYSSWIGATDRGNTTNEWEWLDGPEAGTIFFKSSDATFNLSYYNNWGGVEPNNYAVGDGTRDDYVYILQDGTWADATYGSATSIVEYGDAGCTPNLSAASASFTSFLLTAPGTPQNLTISFPTYQTARVQWQAPASDGGAAITSYAVQYETGGSWISLTPSSLTATISGIGVDNAFSFRVAAVNSVGTGSYANLQHTPPVPYSGPIAQSLSREPLDPGSSKTVTFTGIRLNLVSSMSVDGKTVQIVSQSPTSITCIIPALTAGVKDLLMLSGSGNVTHQGAFEVRAPQTTASALIKVNAGSFKGYVALYALGSEGKRLSAKVGNKWVIVPSIPAATKNLYRLIVFVGPGVDISVRIYIDRVLIETIDLTTK